MIGIDNEYIPENATHGDMPSERPNVQTTYCEIIQMGACKLDSSGNEIAILNLIVKAHKINNVPLWLSNLTGMTNEKRATGISFPEALEQLVEFIGNDNDVWTFNGDWWVLEGNAKAHGIVLPFKKPFNRLKPMLFNYGISITDYLNVGFNEVCSGGLYKVLKINLPKIEGVGAHDAAHDARSLTHSIFKLLNIVKI